MIISWNQFVYAEGDGDEVRIAFASHDVAIKGAGLDPLLRRNRRPSGCVASRERAFRAFFRPRRGGSFNEIVVRRIESEL